ncbi:Methylamine utilisation protein MauE [Chitinophaga sp. CF118]|uniref:MauE/DoxX family redox-associated membrane protein n=1 Tax=Chitinophaga sp. CF118 TaxID=1884367 RepID=UPI0008E74A70|nr:MauE/DoxX family redox-associated membrane protein [Chitinophaga sp. CF118]SFD01278.1 Methylamine utilisation protein MauE [Chitinophaga sp. CF118]
MIANFFIILISVILISLWTYATYSKLSDTRKFRQSLMQQVFPKWVGSILFWVLPLAQLTTIWLLLFTKTRLLGMYASFLLMFAFTLYVAGAVYQVYDRYPCPCGGLFTRMGWYKHLQVNLLLTLLAFAGILLMEFR